MKKLLLSISIIILGVQYTQAQSIQFIHEKLGTCDSAKHVSVTAYLFPDTIKWDSITWKINQVVSAQKTQIQQAQLGDSMIVSFFYDNTAIEIKDTFVVSANQNIAFNTLIPNNDRYAINTSEVWLADSSLFQISNWTISSGTLVSASTGKATILASGYLNITATYNSGCLSNLALYVPMEAQPELLIEQTVLADPIGIPGTIVLSLSDNSTINQVNGNTVNTSSYSLNLPSGLQTITASSGSFSWTKQVLVESLPEPEIKIVQTRLARWCDGTDAEVEIVSTRGIIDSIFYQYMQNVNNDTAYIITDFGDQPFIIYSGSSSVEINRLIEKEDDWSAYSYITEIAAPICSQSADGYAILQNPAQVVYLEIDNTPAPLQDSLLNLSSGTHNLLLADVRTCATTKTFIVPASSENCIQSSDIFTPNGDGINDIYTPIVPQGTILNLKVYTYRDLQMNALASKLVFEGNNSWDGTDQQNGTQVSEAYYLIVNTLTYPAYMNIPVTTQKQIVKLVR